MDILTLKSKVKLGCNMCDKCCIYRGDIKVTPINVCNISRFLGVSNREFIEKYTNRFENRPLELFLKTNGEKRECVLYNNEIHGCGIHKVKPMQCTMFPLVPENLRRDYFYDSEQCKLEDAKQITVNEWLNGNNNNYKKNKKICLEWIAFLEEVQDDLIKMDSNDIEKYNEILFENYGDNKFCWKRQMRKNIKQVKEDIKKKTP